MRGILLQSPLHQPPLRAGLRQCLRRQAGLHQPCQQQYGPDKALGHRARPRVPVVLLHRQELSVQGQGQLYVRASHVDAAEGPPAAVLHRPAELCPQALLCLGFRSGSRPLTFQALQAHFKVRQAQAAAEPPGDVQHLFEPRLLSEGSQAVLRQLSQFPVPHIQADMQGPAAVAGEDVENSGFQIFQYKAALLLRLPGRDGAKVLPLPAVQAAKAQFHGLCPRQSGKALSHIAYPNSLSLPGEADVFVQKLHFYSSVRSRPCSISSRRKRFASL